MGSSLKHKLARMIDHTYLKPDCTTTKVEQLCKEAVQYGFHSVCIPPCFVKAAAALLDSHDTKVCTVIGFPLGFSAGETKLFEAEMAVKDGADELDMVINVGALKENDLDYIKKEIFNLAQGIPDRVLLKVIIETALLKKNEKIAAARTVMETPAAFVKTSTGFASSGATVKDVRLLKRICGSSLEIKAAGGIKDYDLAEALVYAGASRLGCSSSVNIMSE